MRINRLWTQECRSCTDSIDWLAASCIALWFDIQGDHSIYSKHVKKIWSKNSDQTHDRRLFLESSSRARSRKMVRCYIWVHLCMSSRRMEGRIWLLCAQHLKSDRFSMKKTLNRVSGGLWTKKLFRESTTYDYNASISSPPCMNEDFYINSHVNHDKPYPLTLFSPPCVFINIPNLC